MDFQKLAVFAFAYFIVGAVMGLILMMLGLNLLQTIFVITAEYMLLRMADYCVNLSES